MSKLNKLIQELCPNGVEYRKLGEVAEVGTGRSNGNEAIENGEYPFFVRSKDIKRLNKYEYDEEAIIIPGEGGIGDIFHHIKGKYALHQRVYRIHFLTDSVNVRFVYFYMSAAFKSYIMMKAVSATVTSIRKPMIENFSIPLPPLPIQEEIVKILDRFAEYTAELQAELQARKEQYEYYRNLLLTNNFAYGSADDKQKITGNAREEWKWMTLGEVCEICPGKDYKHLSNGEIPVYGSGGVMTFVDSFVYEEPTVLLPRKGSISNVFYVDKPFWNVDTIYYTKIDKSKILPKYFYYLVVNEHIEKYNTSNAARPALTRDVLRKIKLLIPSLELQQRIVSILDKFEALVSDLTQGLPAEIAASQERYEYYRDKLLRFERCN
jgi:type I restriction enzyme S subunit